MNKRIVHHFKTIENGLSIDRQINIFADSNNMIPVQVSFAIVPMSIVVEALVIFEDIQ